jgi:hypothetical protein
MVGIVSVGGLDASRFQYRKVSYFVDWLISCEVWRFAGGVDEN